MLVLRVTHFPSTGLCQLLRLTARTCDPQARVLILRSPHGPLRTHVGLQGNWGCPHDRVLKALALLFCTETETLPYV